MSLRFVRHSEAIPSLALLLHSLSNFASNDVGGNFCKSHNLEHLILANPFLELQVKLAKDFHAGISHFCRKYGVWRNNNEIIPS